MNIFANDLELFLLQNECLSYMSYMYMRKHHKRTIQSGGATPDGKIPLKLMTKGEKFELVFKRVYLISAFFLLSYNSRSFDDFAGSSCNLKLYGGLTLLLSSSACLFLINVNARMLNYISHHISSCISNSAYYMSNACMNYKI